MVKRRQYLVGIERQHTKYLYGNCYYCTWLYSYGECCGHAKRATYARYFGQLYYLFYYRDYVKCRHLRGVQLEYSSDYAYYQRIGNGRLCGDGDKREQLHGYGNY